MKILIFDYIFSGCSLLTSYAVHKFIIHINGTTTAHYLANNRSQMVTCGNYYTWGADSVVTSTTEKGNIIIHRNIIFAGIMMFLQAICAR